MYDSNGAATGHVDGGGAVVAAEGAAGNGEEATAAGEQHAVHHHQPPSNQLTLSFQGDVYVFDGVPPERVSKNYLFYFLFILFFFKRFGCIV